MDENCAGCDFIVKKEWILVAIYKAKGGKISIHKKELKYGVAVDNCFVKPTACIPVV